MRSGARLLLVSLLALTATASSRPARGQGAPGADEEALIKRGLELREQKDDQAALEQFRRAEALSHSGRALAQIALAEQALGHWTDAETHLAEALRHDREPWVARNLHLLQQALADIRSHLGSLELSGGPAGAEVQINGAAAGTLPLGAVRVPAGSVALEVRAPGHLPMLRTVIVPAGGLAREPVVLVPIPASAETPTAAPTVHVDAATSGELSATGTSAAAPPAGGWSGRRMLGAGLVAGGAASLVVGIVFHVTRNGRASDFNDAGCADIDGQISGPPAANCSSRYDDVQHAQDFAIAGYAGAALLGGLGAYLWLTDHGAGDRQRSDGTTASARRGLRLDAFGCGPGNGAGLTCVGRF
jgi:hypothetical protein